MSDIINLEFQLSPNDVCEFILELRGGKIKNFRILWLAVYYNIGVYSWYNIRPKIREMYIHSILTELADSKNVGYPLVGRITFRKHEDAMAFKLKWC